MSVNQLYDTYKQDDTNLTLFLLVTSKLFLSVYTADRIEKLYNKIIKNNLMRQNSTIH